MEVTGEALTGKKKLIKKDMDHLLENIEWLQADVMLPEFRLSSQYVCM